MRSVFRLMYGQALISCLYSSLRYVGWDMPHAFREMQLLSFAAALLGTSPVYSATMSI